MDAGTNTVAKKRINPDRDQIQLRADPKWIDRVHAAAERLGVSISAFLRMAANEKMERMEADRRRRRED